MPKDLALMTADALKALPRDKTVFFYPVGPLEDHGPALPMGLDLLEAQSLCVRAAAKLEADLPGWVGVIMPSAPLGVNANTSETAIRVRAFVLRDWLVDSCRSLIRLGFVHFVCFSGHPGPRQLTAIEDAGKIISGLGFWRAVFQTFLPGRGPRPSLVSAVSALIPPSTVKASPFWPDPAEHGARRDLSVALAIAPSQVSEEALQLPPVTPEATHALRAMTRFRRKLRGYWGSPAGASAEIGEATLKGTLDEVFPKLRAVWEGANPNAIFRSWYSVLPPNKSFLIAWILASCVLVMLLMWMAVINEGLRVQP